MMWGEDCDPWVCPGSMGMLLEERSSSRSGGGAGIGLVGNPPGGLLALQCL